MRLGWACAVGVLSWAIGCSGSSGGGGAGGSGASGAGGVGGSGGAGGSGGTGGASGSGGASGGGGSSGSAGSAGIGGSSGGGALPTIGGCTVFTATSPWNADISGASVHPRNADYLAAFSAEGDTAIHLDLGSTETEYGIPFTVVPQGQALVPLTYGVDGEDYHDESDPGPYPLPLDAPIEGQMGATDPTGGDRHLLVIQQTDCVLYELYAAVRVASPAGFRCASSAKWDLKIDSYRPADWTSADAAGLPIFPGLLRYEEVAAGEIRHATRVTTPHVQNAYVAPASHYGPNDDPTLPPYGLRLRLQASFDESPYSAAAKVLVRAWKKYGLIVADQGSGWYVSGTTNTGWAPLIDEIHHTHPIPGSAFEAVVTAPIHCRYGGAGACD